MDLERESCVAASQCKRGRCKFVLGLKLQCASPPPAAAVASQSHAVEHGALLHKIRGRATNERAHSLKRGASGRSHSLLHSSRAEMAAARLHLRICKMHREAAAYCQTRPCWQGPPGRPAGGAARGSIMAAAALALYIQNKTERGMKMHLRKCQFFFLISSSETR